MYQIAKWTETFEPAQSRRPEHGMPWIRVATKIDSRGMAALSRLDGDGMMAYGVFLKLCSWYGQREKPDRTGVLAHSDGSAMDLEYLSFALSLSDATLSRAMEILTRPAVGWIKVDHAQAELDQGETASDQTRSNTIKSDQLCALEEKRREEKKDKGLAALAPPDSADAAPGGEGQPVTDQAEQEAPEPPAPKAKPSRRKRSTLAAELEGTPLAGAAPKDVLAWWDGEWLDLTGEPHTWANGRAAATQARQLLSRLAKAGQHDPESIRATMRLAIAGPSNFHRSFLNFATRFEEVRANAAANEQRRREAVARQEQFEANNHTISEGRKDAISRAIDRQRSGNGQASGAICADDVGLILPRKRQRIPPAG